MTKCKFCGAPIVWIKTTAGKSMPCNADMVTYWQNKRGTETVVTLSGETIKADIEGDPEYSTGGGYLPHWGFCPGAESFKKRS